MTRQRQLKLQSALNAETDAPPTVHGVSYRLDLQLALFSRAGIIALLALSGCSADMANPGGAAVDTSCLSDAFTVCTTCHYNGAPATLGAGLDLKSDGVAARLVNVVATHADTTGTCPAAKLIDTATPDASWLFVKVNGTQGDCGDTMPLIGNPLTTTQLACLRKFATDEAAALSGHSAGSTGSSGRSGSIAIAGSTGSASTAGTSGSNASGTGGT